MRYLIVLATVATALVASAVASAGGWATVGLDPLPTGVGPGEPWNPNMTILQHGKTPLTGLSPTITIIHDETGASQQFVASETGEPGVYEASVVFPEAGAWSIVADSTFGDSKLTYGPVLIDSPAGFVGVGSEDGFPVGPLVALLAGLGVVAAAAFGIVRQRRLTPAG